MTRPVHLTNPSKTRRITVEFDLDELIFHHAGRAKCTAVGTSTSVVGQGGCHKLCSGLRERDVNASDAPILARGAPILA
jgi:hypothetical protein